MTATLHEGQQSRQSGELDSLSPRRDEGAEREGASKNAAERRVPTATV
jgi:hypothetical protein